MTEFQKIETDCRAAADYYCDNPGHAGPETMIDIYRAIARLAKALDKQRVAAAEATSRP